MAALRGRNAGGVRAARMHARVGDLAGAVRGSARGGFALGHEREGGAGVLGAAEEVDGTQEV